MLKNRVIYILDDSGSMRSLRTHALEVFNSIIASNKKANEKAKQRTETSIMLFSEPYSIQYLQREVNIKKAKEVTKDEYTTAGGSTALFDAVGKGIQDALDSVDADDEETSFLVIVVTDG